MEKISQKDIRILDILDRNPNIALSKLAKKVMLSTQVVDYRIKRLIRQRTIYSFYTLIDLSRIGYSSYRVHLRLKNVDKEKYTNFAKELFTKYPTFWVGFISGSFDMIIDIFAKNSNDFDKIFCEVVEKNKEIIESYDSFRILEINFYNYAYFLNDMRDVIKIHNSNSIVKIDDTDKKILKAIKYNSRMTYQEIGKIVNLSRISVKKRIYRLKKERVISGYKCIINFNHFSKLSYKIFIKYSQHDEKMMKYLKSYPGIFDTVKLLGKWNLDIEIHVNDARELQEFIIALRNKFKVIQNYEIAQILDDYGIDFFPKLQ